ncbi:MAG: tRNA preQ1(34) S-adenosylmethionine ribosyltransferase-isomerase QueA [Cytophagales bacterium]|nr:tRNA preQ1(34) S-adenosylmethionine ribosyltransferase-isomerase QueA [Cytophagales bacterium]
MKKSSFKFPLPQDLIARHPEGERDASRLMVLHRKTGKIEHKHFSDIIEYFDPGDCMVLNDTQVFPARLHGRKEQSGAKIEVMLLRELDRSAFIWSVQVDPARKIRVGNKIFFGKDEALEAEVLDNTTSRGRTITFHFPGSHEELLEQIARLGDMPLPGWIKRDPTDEDRDRYQTVYARKLGAVTAPSAGFHFTPHLLKRLEIKGIDICSVTLHMGMVNCESVDMEDLSKFRMPSENYSIPKETTEKINARDVKKSRIISVGVGTTKALETSLSTQGLLKVREDEWTDKFIFPPYEFKLCDALVTNFHLPVSTMLMLACAFGGHDFVMQAYKEAIKERYRFFNYGDAMLIL